MGYRFRSNAPPKLGFGAARLLIFPSINRSHAEMLEEQQVAQLGTQVLPADWIT